MAAQSGKFSAEKAAVILSQWDSDSSLSSVNTADDSESDLSVNQEELTGSIDISESSDNELDTVEIRSISNLVVQPSNSVLASSSAGISSSRHGKRSNYSQRPIYGQPI
jgi:urease accessory protein UreE